MESTPDTEILYTAPSKDAPPPNGVAPSIAYSANHLHGNGRGKNSAAKIGGGAAVGAGLRGILGGGKGAAIGAAAGGGAGAGVQAVTRGPQVQIESETLVSFRLTSPITVRLSTGGQEPNSQSNPVLQRHP